MRLWISNDHGTPKNVHTKRHHAKRNLRKLFKIKLSKNSRYLILEFSVRVYEKSTILKIGGQVSSITFGIGNVCGWMRYSVHFTLKCASCCFTTTFIMIALIPAHSVGRLNTNTSGFTQYGCLTRTRNFNANLMYNGLGYRQRMKHIRSHQHVQGWRI